MKSKVENVVKTKHSKYDDFLLKQYIIDLDVGDKIIIQTFDKNNNLLDTKEFEAKQINCHINCTWQDKGDKNHRKEKNEM